MLNNQRLRYSINMVYEIRRQKKIFIVFTSEYTILNKKEHWQRIAHCDSTGKTIFLSPQRDWLYSWVVILLPIPYLTFVTKFEPLCGLKKIVSQYCVYVRSFEHLCGGRKVILQYGDSVQSFPNDSIFACKTKKWRTRARTSICSNGFH